MIACYRRCVAAVLLLGIGIFPTGPLAARDMPESSAVSSIGHTPAAKKLILLSVPGFSFMELEPPHLSAMPVLAGLNKRGAWGSMNVRTPGRGLEDVYLSLGAGNFAEGGQGVQGMQREEAVEGESAWQRYRRYGGSGTDSAVVVKEAEAMRRANAANYYRAEPGLLGEKLQTAGVRLSVWGNADRAGAAKEANPVAAATRRYAPLMLMNRSNTVKYGNVSGAVMIPDSNGPAGWRTNYPLLLERWKQQPAPSVTLLELGDFQRLYDEKAYYTDEAFAVAKRRVIAELDRFIGSIARTMEESGTAAGAEMWLFSPQVNADAAKEKAYLAPLFLFTYKNLYITGHPAKYLNNSEAKAPLCGDILSPAAETGRPTAEALLTSETTRREGIVSLVDIAPTILSRFGLPTPPEMIGLPIYAERQPSAFEKLLSQVKEMRQVYAIRPALLYGLAIYEIVVMIAVLAATMFAAGRIGKRGAAVGKALLFSLLLAPAGLVSMGWLPGEPSVLSAVVALGAVAALSAGCAANAAKPERFVAALAAVGLGVALLLLYDGMHGAKAMQRSVLGYDPMIGARYYGMGNECMGVLLGASLLGLTALQQAVRLGRRQRDKAAAPATMPGAAAQAAAPAAPGAARATAPRGGLTAWRLPQAGTLVPWLRARGPLAGAAALPAPALAAARSRSRLAIRAAAVWRAWPAAAVGAAVAGYLASPALGTNAGGALSAAVGFGALGARLAGGRRWLRTVPALALLLGAALVLLWLLNPGAAAGGQSHIGRGFDTLLQGRLDAIGAIILRKLQMNWHLIGVSAWSKVLLTSMAVMAVLVLRPRGLLRRWQRRYPYMMYGCAAGVIGAIAALLLNDSGIVAAATMIVYSSVPLLLLKLEGA